MAKKTNNKKDDLFGSKDFSIVDPIFGATDEAALAGLYKETGSNIVEKQAAIYKREGMGKMLQRQQNLGNIFDDVIDLWEMKKVNEINKYNKDVLAQPKFDNSDIFGNIDFTTEITNINTKCESIISQLSKMNGNEEGYKELRNELESLQSQIISYNDVNQKLLTIRNLEKRGLRNEWSANMSDDQIAMWEDIMKSNGENIKIVDGKVIWTNPGIQGILGTNDLGDAFLNQSGWSKTTNILQSIRDGYITDANGNQIEISTDFSEENEKIMNLLTGTVNGVYSPLQLLEEITNMSKMSGVEGAPDIEKIKEHYEIEDYEHEDYIENLQNALIALGPEYEKLLGENGADGKWGPDTEKAFKLYLENRDEIMDSVTSTFMETNEDAFFNKGQIGGGTEIDLNEINVEGPQLKSDAWVALRDFKYNHVDDFVNRGGVYDSAEYQNTLSFEVNRMLMKMSAEDLMSTIFDSLKGGNLHEGFADTTGFLKLIIENIPQFANMAEMDAINLLRELGPYTPLGDENGVMSKDTTLLNMFQEWLISDYFTGAVEGSGVDIEGEGSAGVKYGALHKMIEDIKKKKKN